MDDIPLFPVEILDLIAEAGEHSTKFSFKLVNKRLFRRIRATSIFYDRQFLLFLIQQGRKDYLAWMFDSLGHFEDPARTYPLILQQSLANRDYNLFDWMISRAPPYILR